MKPNSTGRSRQGGRENRSTASPNRPETGPPPASVLVVVDDARVRAAFCALLDESGDFHCRALDQAAAMGLVGTRGSGHAWGIAIVDWLGAAAIGEQARLVAALATVAPVVVVSMSGAARTVALEAGAAAFVDKDGDAGALLAVIRLVARL